MGISWQTQVTLALMLVGGGYLLFYNKFPPFDKGGLADQLKKYLPTSGQPQGDTNDNKTTGDLSNDMIPIPGQGADAGPQGPQGQMPYMDNPLPARPTFGDHQVYNDYATALRMQYGQGNNPNLGGGQGQSDAYGDVSLGTTPVPGSLFGLSGSQGSSQPPPYPFLPSPFTPNTGMYRPPPAGFPPMMPMPHPMPFPSWVYQPVIPRGQPYWATWAVKRPLPYIYSIPQLFSIDLGIIDHKLSGITIGIFLQMGVRPNTIFPMGINLQNQYQIGVDLTHFVKVYLRLHSIKPSRRPRFRNKSGFGIDIDLGNLDNLGSNINDMVKGIMDKVKGKIGDKFGSGSGFDLDDLLGGSGIGIGSGGINVGDAVNIGTGGINAGGVGIGSGGINIPGIGSGIFGNMFGSGGNNSNNFNFGSGGSIPSARSINSNVFNQLRAAGVRGFHATSRAMLPEQIPAHARAILADKRPKIGFMNQRNSNSLQPHIKRTKHMLNNYLNKVST